VYGPWRYAARRGMAEEFRMRTWREEGGGNMRSSEGVYVSVYLHGDLAICPTISPNVVAHCPSRIDSAYSVHASRRETLRTHLTTSPTLTLPF